MCWKCRCLIHKSITTCHFLDDFIISSKFWTYFLPKFIFSYLVLIYIFFCAVFEVIRIVRWDSACVWICIGTYMSLFVSLMVCHSWQSSEIHPFTSSWNKLIWRLHKEPFWIFELITSTIQIIEVPWINSPLNYSKDLGKVQILISKLHWERKDQFLPNCVKG